MFGIIFSIFISCRWITLVEFKDIPDTSLTKIENEVKLFYYNKRSIGTMVKCLMNEKIESAVTYNSGYKYILRNDGNLEKYDPQNHKTKWLFLKFNNQDIIQSEIKEYRENIIKDHESSNKPEEIEKNENTSLIHKYDHLNIKKLYHVSKKDNNMVDPEIISKNETLIQENYNRYSGSQHIEILSYFLLENCANPNISIQDDSGGKDETKINLTKESNEPLDLKTQIISQNTPEFQNFDSIVELKKLSSEIDISSGIEKLNINSDESLNFNNLENELRFNHFASDHIQEESSYDILHESENSHFIENESDNLTETVSHFFSASGYTITNQVEDTSQNLAEISKTENPEPSSQFSTTEYQNSSFRQEWIGEVYIYQSFTSNISTIPMIPIYYFNPYSRNYYNMDPNTCCPTCNQYINPANPHFNVNFQYLNNMVGPFFYPINYIFQDGLGNTQINYSDGIDSMFPRNLYTT